MKSDCYQPICYFTLLGTAGLIFRTTRTKLWAVAGTWFWPIDIPYMYLYFYVLTFIYCTLHGCYSWIAQWPERLVQDSEIYIYLCSSPAHAELRVFSLSTCTSYNSYRLGSGHALTRPIRESAQPDACSRAIMVRSQVRGTHSLLWASIAKPWSL